MCVGIEILWFSLNKMYRHCLGKAKDSMEYKKFIQYRNMFNSQKRIIKETYFAEQLSKYRSDLKKLGKYSMILLVGKPIKVVYRICSMSIMAQLDTPKK